MSDMMSTMGAKVVAAFQDISPVAFRSKSGSSLVEHLLFSRNNGDSNMRIEKPALLPEPVASDPTQRIPMVPAGSLEYFWAFMGLFALAFRWCNSLRGFSSERQPFVACSNAARISEVAPIRHLPVPENAIPVERRSPRKQMVMGHRGAVYWAAENTLASFQHCIDFGVDAVEFDVFCLSDGELVVFHGVDREIDAGQGCEGMTTEGFLSGLVDLQGLPLDTFIEELDTQTVTALRYDRDSPILVCPPMLRAAAIPTLRQVLSLCAAHHLKMTLELKSTAAVCPAVDLVQTMGILHLVTFSSFDHLRIQLVKKLCPAAITAALFDRPLSKDFVQIAYQVGADEVDMHYLDCTASVVAEAHAAGLQAMVWLSGAKDMQVPEDEVLYQTLLATGVDILCVNRPDLLCQLVDL